MLFLVMTLGVCVNEHVISQPQLAHLLKNNTCQTCFIGFSKGSNGITLMKAIFKQQRTVIGAGYYCLWYKLKRKTPIQGE